MRMKHFPIKPPEDEPNAVPWRPRDVAIVIGLFAFAVLMILLWIYSNQTHPTTQNARTSITATE